MLEQEERLRLPAALGREPMPGRRIACAETGDAISAYPLMNESAGARTGAEEARRR